MKKLICASEMEAFLKEGQKIFYIDKDTIITPSAKDLAKNNGITFSTEMPAAPVQKAEQACVTAEPASTQQGLGDIDGAVILKVFQMLKDKGLLQGFMETLSGQLNTPYTAESDCSGLKVVRGNTVKMDVFETGNPNATAYFQELVSKDESAISAGFLVIENSRFEWELTYEEIDYVIEGTLTIEINGKVFTAYPGDVLFVPKNSKVIWGSPDKARVFYATYPANWADLL